MIGASVITDSVHAHTGHRLTTIEVTMHRFVLAEFNTHRVFSRNSASSRAIPFTKQVKRVVDTTAIPVEWRSEQRGMQGGDLIDEDAARTAKEMWESARDEAVIHAQSLADLGVHKSIVNRLLEPFMYHTVIVSSTEWDGFWKQRCSPLAQPEIRVVAEMMQEVYDESEPEVLEIGEWHLPYIDSEDHEQLSHIVYDSYKNEILKRISVARCARVSYLTHDGKRDHAADLGLFERLVTADPMHASPLEHVATPVSDNRLSLEQVPGNFRGWRQMRHDYQSSPYHR